MNKYLQNSSFISSKLYKYSVNFKSSYIGITAHGFSKLDFFLIPHNDLKMLYIFTKFHLNILNQFNNSFKKNFYL